MPRPLPAIGSLMAPLTIASPADETTEARLRWRERQLAEVQALAHVGAWERELAGSRATWNPELCRIFGQPRGFTPTYAQFRELVHPADRDLLDAHLRDISGGLTALISYRIIRADGEVRHVQGRSHGRAGEDGEVRLRFGTIQDITEHHHAEVVRRQAQELFETAFAHAPIGMALVALDGRWMKVNRAVCEMLDWPREELLRLTFQDITHPDDLDADLARVQRLVAGEINGYELEKRYITRTAKWIWVRLSVSLVRDESGHPCHFISQLQDITQRKEDERRLRAAEAEARAQRDHATAIIGAMHEGYALTVDGEVKAVNGALCVLTGFAEHELVGTRTPFPFWPPEDRAGYRTLRNDVLHHRGGTFAVTLMRKTGERFEAEVTVQPALDSAGHTLGFVNTVRDVSVQRRQQRELELLARTDSLTGLGNRYVLQESLERAAALARRHGRRLALVLLDLDWFKQVNDRHGHPVGDAVLVEVSRRLAQTVRNGEVLARVGGEEFAWLLPEATAQLAVTVGDRARRAIESTPFPIAGQLTMSAGVGVMDSPSDGEALYRLADRALYDAKQRGRNRTCCHTLVSGTGSSIDVTVEVEQLAPPPALA